MTGGGRRKRGRQTERELETNKQIGMTSLNKQAASQVT
jgi:hypothetical protein